MSTVCQDELLEALELRGAGLLLLPHARAARELRSAFDARQRARGLEAWEPAAVLSWAQWTSSLWSELVVAGAEERLLLNAAQEHSLWREIVAADAEIGASGPVDALAEMARSGWALAAAHGVGSRLRGAAGSYDSRRFAGWAEEFSRRCGTKGYLPAAGLDEALRQHVERGAVAAPEGLELVGFGEKTPAQEALLAAMRGRGTVVLERGLTAEARGLRAAVVAASEREELELAARWIRGFMRQRPGARVAVLAPNLGEERAEMEEVFRQTLAPELQALGEDLSSTPWEFSGGEALASVAMVADALALARWAEGALTVRRVSALLLSPYVGRQEDRDGSARFDAGTLRREKLLRSEIEIAPLLAMVEAAEAKQGRKFLPWLRSVQGFLVRDGDRSRPRGFAEWMEFVRGLAQAAGWPGDRALTATEFEATRAWESALDTVSTLDFSGRRVGLSSALEALELQARTAVVAPPSTGAAVQVMGVAEAEGSVFDAVVFPRATDANWPPVERVHPLLPWGLQKDLRMPGSDPALAAERARAFTRGLLARSGSVLFTSAAEDEDGTLRVSPVVAELGVETVAAEDLVGVGRTEELVALESVVDGEALPGLPSGEIGGGAGVLKAQAACGFRAFAEFRLGARELESQELGLDAGESGGGLHKALQEFWKNVGTRDALADLVEMGELDEALRWSIDRAMERYAGLQNGWEAAYVEVQKERMRSVLRQWMEWELKRGPFELFESERRQKIEVGPLTLEVRYDRIDRVGDGFFVVDYKTGLAGHPKQWEGERPDDPQLPLYALPYEPGEMKGMAFAKVRVGEMKWLGVQAEAGILPGERTSVAEMEWLLEGWRAVLTQLAQDFADGRVEVSPKTYPGTCEHCAQRILCRLDPETLRSREEEEDREGEIDG